MTEFPLILASASPSRVALLRAAGLDFTQMPTKLDEDSLRTAMTAEEQDPDSQAMQLAEMKAQIISRRYSGIVIGSDQMLVCDGAIFSKPKTMAQAREHLQILSGKTHYLATAICACENGDMVWKYLDRPRLTMRILSDGFISDYLDQEGEQALTTPGCYRLEARGVQLFSRIEGDYFSIRGLPLLPVLTWLRDRGIID